MLIFVATIPTATVAGVLAAAAVEKLFFTVVGVLVFAYLLIAVGGSFEPRFGFLSHHPWAVAIAVVGAPLVLTVAGEPRARLAPAEADGSIDQPEACPPPTACACTPAWTETESTAAHAVWRRS